MKKSLLPYILILLFFTMLINSSFTFQGALKGLNLWLFTVTPSLLPYMIISSFMTETGTFLYLSRFFKPITKYLFRLHENCGYVILLGFLCGYPIGSKLSADLVKKGYISQKEGQILLSFCNNISPAFLITYLIDQIIAVPEKKWLILSIMIGTPLAFGIFISQITFFFTRLSGHPLSGHHTGELKKLSKQDSESILPGEAASLDACIISGFENIFKLGGYIILFSIINEFISNYLTLMPSSLCRICSLTEITSGLSTYQSISMDEASRIIECTTLAAFGGVCCIAQTASMIKGSGLSLSRYIMAKAAIAFFTFVLTSLIFVFL